MFSKGFEETGGRRQSLAPAPPFPESPHWRPPLDVFLEGGGGRGGLSTGSAKTSLLFGGRAARAAGFTHLRHLRVVYVPAELHPVDHAQSASCPSAAGIRFSSRALPAKCPERHKKNKSNLRAAQGCFPPVLKASGERDRQRGRFRNAEAADKGSGQVRVEPCSWWQC